MAREVYPSKEFVEFSKNITFVRLFADVNEEGAALEKKYGVRGYPTLLVFNSKGQLVDRLVGARDSAEELIEDLKAVIESANDPSVVMDEDEI